MMPVRIPVNFPHSSAYLIKIKVHNTRPWYLHHPYRISRGPCVPSFSLPDTLGRSFLNWKLHLQQGQLPRPLSPASCYLSKASPKQPQDHSSSGSCPSVPAWRHWWSLTSSCWGHCSSLARTATALLLRCLVFQAVFTPTVFDPGSSARTFLNHTSSSPFLWPLWRDTHALDPQLLLSSSGTPLPSHPPTVWEFSPIPRKSLGTREQLCCWQGKIPHFRGLQQTSHSPWLPRQN